MEPAPSLAAVACTWTDHCYDTVLIVQGIALQAVVSDEIGEVIVEPRLVDFEDRRLRFQGFLLRRKDPRAQKSSKRYPNPVPRVTFSTAAISIH
jgi:hypothetical protein